MGRNRLIDRDEKGRMGEENVPTTDNAHSISATYHRQHQSLCDKRTDFVAHRAYSSHALCSCPCSQQEPRFATDSELILAWVSGRLFCLSESLLQSCVRLSSSLLDLDKNSGNVENRAKIRIEQLSKQRGIRPVTIEYWAEGRTSIRFSQ